MTTNVYWAEVVQETDPTNVYWAEVEQTSVIGEAVSGSAELPEVTTVTLVGGSTILAGATLDLTATLEDQDGDPVPNFSDSASSTDTGVATVSWLTATDTSGEATVRATGVAGGSTQVTVTADSQLSALQVVEVIAVTTVTLVVPAVALEVGTTGSATVTVRDQNGDPMSGISITWASTVDAVIADPAGTTTGAAGTSTVSLPALAAGTTTITATAGGVASSGVVVGVSAVAAPPSYSASGSSQIVVTAESRLAGWERPRVRRFNDADQKKTYPTDRFFEGMTEGVEVEIVWPNRAVLRAFS